MKTITGWLFAGVLLAALLYLQLCRTPKPDTSNNDAYARLVKKQTDTINYYEELLKADSAALDLAIYKAEKAAQEQIQTDNDLQVTQKQVADLSAKLRLARTETPGRGPDDMWVPVSPRYVSACDSLEVAANKQGIAIRSSLNANNALRTELTYTKAAYEQQLQTEKNFNLSLRNQLTECNKVVKDSTVDNKRVQLYAGFNLLGNKTQFINGGLVSLTLLTKRNTMFEANAGLFNGEMYYGGGTKLLISFRKNKKAAR